MGKMFAGQAKVYNEDIFVDSSTGTGLDSVLRKIDPLLHKMSRSIYIPGYTTEDLKQELAILAIEGIRSYDGTKNVKLSTFLHIHLHNKIVSKIRSKNKLSNNASASIENASLPDTCNCGSTIFMVETKSGEERRRCVSCDKLYTKKLKNAKTEIPFSVMDERIDHGDEGKISFVDSVSRDGSMFAQVTNPEDLVEMSGALADACSDMDDKTKQLIQLVCLEDYSIKDAADKIGMSSWAANVRLKGLSKNKKVRELLSK